MAGTYNLLFINTTKLFPTVVRNVALGCATHVAQMRAILSPFVMVLGEGLPFAVCWIAGDMFAFYLLKTLNKPLYDIIAGMEDGEGACRSEELDSRDAAQPKQERFSNTISFISSPLFADGSVTTPYFMGSTTGDGEAKVVDRSGSRAFFVILQMVVKWLWIQMFMGVQVVEMKLAFGRGDESQRGCALVDADLWVLQSA
ncbi:hypothetical protein ACE6H2_014733 [Prunus campanulata]